VIGVTVLVGLWHSANYFFVFDDFSLVDQALARTPREIFGTALYGFYRPLAFLFTQSQSALAGWDAPWLYAGASLCLHYINAWLVARLARAIGLDSPTAYLAGALFLCSAWAAEAFFWISGRFDLLACTGLLACLLAGLGAANAATPRRAFLLSIGAGVAAAAALLAKETAVVGPVLLVIVIAASLPAARLRATGSLATVVVVSAVTGLYVWHRERILPGLGGMYGPLESLMQSADLAGNGIAFVVRLLTPPLPDSPAPSLSMAAAGLYACAMVVLWSHLAVTRQRLALCVLVSMITLLVPVVWVNLYWTGAGKSRFLYLPGIWCAIGLAAAIRDGAVAGRLSTIQRGTLLGAAGLVVVGQLTSLGYQAWLWQRAGFLASSAIAQVAARATPGEAIYIPNLPWVLASGQPVMQPAVIAIYLREAAPRVRARGMELRADGDGFHFVGWNPGAPGPPEALADETLVELSLPTIGVPAAEVSLDGAIVLPAAGPVPQTFTIEGWALDRSVASGAGIDAVHVWAHAESPTPPIFLGEAMLRRPSPDVAAREGARFAAAGFVLAGVSLPPGRYQIQAHPHLVATGAFGPAFTVVVEVR
jgi:hypothetical protein